MAVKALVAASVVAALAWPSQARAADPEPPLVVAGSVVLGFGGIAFAAAIPLHVRSRRARLTFDDRLYTGNAPTGLSEVSWAEVHAARTESRRASIATGLAYTAAIVGITAGATLLAIGLARKKADEHRATARVSLTPTGVVVGGRF